MVITKFITLAFIAFFAGLTGGVKGFSTSPLPSQNLSRSSLTVSYAYIPAGFTKESWEAFKKKEAKKKENLGMLGPKGFESRSLQSFQEALERGEAGHLMPMFNAKEKLKSGRIKTEDIPYMQRGMCIYYVYHRQWLFVLASQFISHSLITLSFSFNITILFIS